MAVYEKELTFNKVTKALFIFVKRQQSAVQLGLMAVIEYEFSVLCFLQFPGVTIQMYQTQNHMLSYK